CAPIYQGDRFLGLAGARFTATGLLRHTLPPRVLEGNRAALMGPAGLLLSTSDDGRELDPAFSRAVSLTTLGNDTSLRLDRYARHYFNLEVWLMAGLCVSLTLGMAWGMWALARVAEERKTAQETAQRERDNLVNVFEAMEDGVAVVNPSLDVEYVNPILVKDFGPFAGRKCYEYFHGHQQKCEWCMMDDVIAGKAVHTEWCYPRNGRTYDLIDTRVENADGSVSKLKMFRDMTERAEAQTALKESEERFHHLFESAADALFLHDSAGRIIEVNQAACDALGYARPTFRDLRMADITPGYESSRTSPRDGDQGHATVLAEQVRSDRTRFPVEIRAGSLEYAGERLMLASARDITERRRAEAAIRGSLEAEKAAASEARRRLEESESLQRVTTALLQKITQDEVLEVVCQEAQRLTAATGTGVLLLEGEDLVLTRWTGRPEPHTTRMRCLGSFAGAAARQGTTQLVNDVASHDLAHYRDPRPQSLLSAPLRLAGGVIGVLDVSGHGRSFTEADARIISHLADQAAVAIHTARLRHQAEQVRVMEERQRLARELHDSVTQALYSITMFTDATRRAIAAERRDQAAEHLEDLRGAAREAMLEMRLLIFELHPPALEDEGFVGALKTRLAAVESRAGLSTELQVEGRETPLPAATEEALYRLAQEGLNNSIKHASASRVTVRVRFLPEAVSLTVADDGVGFEANKALTAGGVGLRGMRERVERLAGTLHISSAPGQGTTLIAEIPVAPSGKDAS
ncbi:MAG TPA: PAS domain S-box protein, partial [Deferrisomatales bacterium]|nr:PAS domain S-box protein [Deferrisomatales bacterium]